MSAPAPTRGDARRDTSMALLTALTESSLDEGYAEAAARRPGGAEPPRRGVVLGVGVLAAGLLLGTAGAQTRNRESVVAEAREELIERIEERSASSDRLAGDVAALRTSVADVRRQRLRSSAEGARLARELTALEAAVGAAAVEGPGLVVRIENAPEPDGQEAQDDPRAAEETFDGKLTDRDLQTIVNEVWLAGAEAVAVNDQRLTSLSAIRAAGPNILVAFRPLSPPYDIVAIGDPEAMRTKLTNGFAGSYLEVLRNYGMRSSIRTVKSARAPASSALIVRRATVPTGGGGA